MSIWGFGEKRWAVAVVVAVLGLATIARAETDQERRLRQLELQLQRTQEQLKQLQGEMEKQKTAVRAQEEQLQHAADTADLAKAKTTKLPDWLSSITPFGDVRIRTEGFYHQPHLEGQVVTANTRERVRARFGLRANYGDEVGATVRIASGNINDPISTNETLTGNFNRKNFNLDWAYLTFTPGDTFHIRPGTAAITVGKFPNPIFRTDEMVFDEDLSLEGASETFQLLPAPVGALDQVKVHALQWTFAEIANAQDGWMFGGQVNPSFHLGPVQLEGGLGQYWWLNPDLIAQSLSRNTTAFTASGAPVANSSFNSTLANTNLLRTKHVQPPTPAGGKRPNPFDAIVGYQSGFNQSNLTISATVPNVLLDKAMRFWGDYIYNWDAATDDAHGWTAGLRLGQQKRQGDWSLFGFYEHLGQEATISSFAFSDFGTAGTNVKGPGVGIEYQLLDPLTVSARGYFTNYINRPADNTNPTLTRFQLDALVKF
jgi:hypothetical protein